MLLVMALAAGILILLYKETPRIIFEGQRQKERLLVERGEGYRRAIQLFVRANKRLPQRIEDLEKFQDKRFLRQKYKDPLTGKDEWRLIHTDAAGIPTDSLTQKRPDPMGKDKKPGDPSNPLAGGMGTDPNQPGGVGGVPGMPQQPQIDPVTGQPIPTTQPRRGASDRPAAIAGTEGQGGGAGQPFDPNRPYDPNKPYDPNQQNQYANNPYPPNPNDPNAAGQGIPTGQQTGQIYDPNNPQVQPIGAGIPGQNATSGTNPNMPIPIPIVPGQPGFQGMPGLPTQPYQPGYPSGQTVYPNQQQPGQYNPTGQAPMYPSGNFPTGIPGLPQGSQAGLARFPGAGTVANSQTGGIPAGSGQPLGATGNAAADMIRNILQTPRGGVPGQGASAGLGAGILGVASKADGEGIRVYNERKKYKEWEFLYDPKLDKPPGGGGMSAFGQPNQLGQQPSSSMNSPSPMSPGSTPSFPSTPTTPVR